ncbi:hypothetical protein F4810DRAFT_720117 [Camillea tinctor]|nr:hypothetical protein F4810DRAFT_720117 [Camillea tinctor]
MNIPFQGQLSSHMELPHWEDEALKSHGRIFRHVISDFDDMRDKEARYLSLKNKRATHAEDIPSDPQELQELVRRLWIAIYNTEDVVEAENSDAIKAIMKKPRWSEGEVHLALWKLLDAMINAQRGVCTLPTSYTSGGPIYQEFDGFYSRFESVEEGLKRSKALCRSVLCMDLFIARIAWNPTAETNRKSVNLNLNMGKNTLQAIGLYHAHKDEITRDENGNLVDHEGNVIPQNTKHKATAALKRETANTKRRKRPSARASVNKKMEHRVKATAQTQDQNAVTQGASTLGGETGLESSSPFLSTDVGQAIPSTAGPNQGNLETDISTMPLPSMPAYSDQPNMLNYDNQAQLPRQNNDFIITQQPGFQNSNQDPQWSHPQSFGNSGSSSMGNFFDFRFW